jgi:oxaloacetate decarboxylase beta subunit
MEKLIGLWSDSGIAHMTIGQSLMMLICLMLFYLAIRKGFEPLLLLPIGFGGLLANIPAAGLAWSSIEAAIHTGSGDVLMQLGHLFGITQITPDTLMEAYKTAIPSVIEKANLIAADNGYHSGMLYDFFEVAVSSEAAPLIIFMGVGAMTDFGPLLANPRTMFLGAAAQFGIFATVLGAVGLSSLGWMDFTMKEAAGIGIIGGADGPTSIYVASKLAPDLLGAIAVAAYSYMAMVPLIQPPIMRALTTVDERKIVMTQLRHVGRLEKILFPICLLILVALLIPSASPLLGMFCLGNLMRESGVVDRLSDTAQNSLINITTIFLGLSVGSKLSADKFLDLNTLGIMLLGIIAFSIGTASGVLMAKLMNKFSSTPINPLIGSAGVSAVPMAARVSNSVGLESNPQNFLLMHAMGPNVAGVIGSAVAAGVMISFFS